MRSEENFNYKKVDITQINAYFLIDINNAVIENDSIIIDEEIDYICNKKIENLIPIVAKITDYPVIQIDSLMSGQGLLLGADLADLVGRSHIHRTKLKIKSGNFAYELNLPVELYIKIGDVIEMYVSNRVVKRIFCDGIIYEF